MGAVADELARMVGPAGAQLQDRVWLIKPGTLDWDVLLGKLWFRTMVSLSALNMTRGEVERVSELRSAVEAELARR